MTSLLEFDLFDLLKLSHLSEEEKEQRTKEIEEIVYSSLVTDDLPGLLPPEDLAEFFKITGQVNAQKDQEKVFIVQNEALKFLRSKVTNWDELVILKLLAFKKEMVRDNMLERMDIVRQELEENKSEKDADAKLHRLVELEKERNLLEKILKLIDTDSWDIIPSLIQQLPE